VRRAARAARSRCEAGWGHRGARVEQVGDEHLDVDRELADELGLDLREALGEAGHEDQVLAGLRELSGELVADAAGRACDEHVGGVHAPPYEHAASDRAAETAAARAQPIGMFSQASTRAGGEGAADDLGVVGLGLDVAPDRLVAEGGHELPQALVLGRDAGACSRPAVSTHSGQFCLAARTCCS
jgi:hypothetical protein